MKQNVTQQINHLMLFDLDVGGHHAGYIRHLLHYRRSNDFSRSGPQETTEVVTTSLSSPGNLREMMTIVEKISVVVSSEFLRRHLDVVDITTAANVEWVAISEAELSWYRSSFGSLVRRAWVEWRLFCRYAKQLGADHGLVMYIDRFQLPLALQLPAPCDVSGIYFRPTFHYKHVLADKASLNVSAETRRDRFRALRQSWLWRLACRHPRLKVLFSLDPLAVEPLQRLGRAKVVHLPDPVEQYQQENGSRTTNKLRDELEIEEGRRVFLLFGSLNGRKGIYKLLDSITGLPVSELARLCVLLVGRVTVADKAQLQSQITSISHSLPLQIILRNQFVAEEEVPLYFDIADVVLAPYQRHVGMSGILLWAAALGKPVLASDYGLMGEIVRQHSLGITLDSTKPSEIAEGVSAFLAGEPTEMFDSDSAALFARENSAEAFARVVWENLGRI